MSTDLTRLTLYAVLTSIETDLAGIVSDHILPNKTEKQIFGEDLLKKLTDRQEKDNKQNEIDEDLLHYTDFGDKTAIILREIEMLPKGIRRNVREICKELNGLIPIRNRVMHSRP